MIEEVANAIAELFMYCCYTIPLIGFFHSIAKMIVEKSVALLQLVPDSTSNPYGSIDEFEEDINIQKNEYLCNMVGIVG